MSPQASTSCSSERGDQTHGSAQFIDHPSGFLAVSPRNERFSLDGCPGFVSYREQGRHLVSFGGAHAPPESAAKLLDGFVKFAKARRRRVLIVQARETQVPLLRGLGFRVNQLGTTYSLRLGGYTFSGAAKMKLRNKLRRAQRAGLKVMEIGHELPRTQASFDLLHQISDAWLAKKHKKELDFMIGEIGTPQDVRRRVFLVQDRVGKSLGFITYVPAWCDKPGMLHDLTRRIPAAPPGTMELCNAFAMERFRGEGVQHLHFGFTPFIVDEREPEGGNRLFAWITRKLRRYGSAIYPADSQAQYKLKWGIDHTEREYVAARPLSLRSIWDLLLLTRSL